MSKKKKLHLNLDRRQAMSLMAGAAVPMGMTTSLIGLNNKAAAAKETIDQPISEPDKETIYDPLTSLPNAALFEDHVRLFEQLGLERITVSIINIETGYLAPDIDTPVLRDVIDLTMARRMQRILTERFSLARLDRHQFGLILSDTTPIELSHTLETIRRSLSAPVRLIQKERLFTASIGTVLKNEITPAANIEWEYKDYRHKELIKQAHNTVAEACKSGRNSLLAVDEQIRVA